MTRIEDLTTEQLWQLRKEVTLNSLFVADYRNSFGITPRSACELFDGYVSFLQELADDAGTSWTAQDSPEHLQQWTLCFDDLSWIEYEPVEN